jgi:hypothetical protein
MPNKQKKNLSFSPDTVAMLEQIAEHNGTTLSGIISILIRQKFREMQRELSNVQEHPTTYTYKAP